MEDVIKRKKRLEKVMAILKPKYGGWVTFLEHKDPWQLLVATVLSAQCTDERVNQVTPALFAAFPSPAALASAPLADVEKLVHSTGFYRAKAHNIKALSRQIAEKYGGKAPCTMEELTALPGVGRKTAGVVLSVCFGKQAIIVDTHFARVCRRLGLTASERQEVIERDVAAIADESEWTPVSNALNIFGRDVCHARKPACGECPVAALCPSREDN
jgi:endonuclease-3